MADFSEILELSDDKLIKLHKNLHGDISNSAIVEAHHLVTNEMARRGIEHGHIDDEWAIVQVEVDSVQSVDLENITTELSDELATEVAKKIGISGDVKVMLGIEGYELQIEKSLFEDDLTFDEDTFEKTIRRRGGKYVVFSEDGTREFGTYDTKAEAEKRLAQIERFKEMDKAEGHKPPASVQEAAQRALDWISEGKAGQGFTSVGRGRARQLASGQSVGIDTLKRMRSYFARHIVDKKAEGFSRGEKGYPSPGKVAWDAWGGDAGRAWAESILDRMEKSENPEMYDPEEFLNPRQKVLYATIENVVSEFGAFDGSDGADGAHYMDADNNPFAEKGLNCANCVFFAGGGGCEILNIEVEPMGVCKFWIIPEKLVVEKHGTHDQSSHGNWAGARVSAEVASKIFQFTREWGGLTINMVDGSMPTTGYVVAKPPEFGKVVTETDFFDSVKGPKILSQYMREHKTDLASGKNYLGTWVDKGKVFLDVSQNIQSKSNAIRLGKERDQKAIWDVVNQVEIDTGGTGGIEKAGQNGGVEKFGEHDRRRDRQLRSGDLEEIRREYSQANDEVEKHGTHNQLDHGNWATRARRLEAMTAKNIPNYVTDAEGRILNPDATGGYKAGIPEKVNFAGQELTPKDSLWHHLVSDGKGGYEPSQERAYLHEQIIASITQGVPVSADPTFTMLGGGPASGKSTFANSGQGNIPNETKAIRINADDIKEMLPENPRMRQSRNDSDFFRAAEFVHEESSLLAKRVQNRAIRNKQDIVLDGTGDSAINKLAKKVNEAKDAGYKVNAVYVTISTDEAWKRSSARALGPEKRYVPESVVRGTHKDVSITFPQAIRGGLFDSSSLWDNSGSSAKLIGSGTGSQFNVSDQSAYNIFLAKGNE